MCKTKDMELDALSKIKDIIAGMGEDSYVARAFNGCVEFAEENIRDDAWIGFSDLLNKIDELKSRQTELEAELLLANKELKKFKSLYEAELEWVPYPCVSGLTPVDYLNLQKFGESWEDKECIEYVHAHYGFSRDFIHILTEIPAYEVNRHHRLRLKYKEDRRPVYGASDYNYLAFSVGGYAYEVINGELRINSELLE